jgi:hypothetical protein
MDGFAEQENLEAVSIGIILKEWLDLEDQAMSVGHTAAPVHGDGHLNRQPQHPQVILSMAFPPYPESFLAELHRLDMGASQVQSSHLVDDEVTECLIGSEQESVIGLEML